MRLETNNAGNPIAVLALAHGAGAGMEHPFMVSMGNHLAATGITTIRFNFPYMESGKKFPGSPVINIDYWGKVREEVIRQYPDLPFFMAGKSYGGRMGSHLLAQAPDQNVRGIIYLGFPLHAPGRDSKDRAAHLPEVKVPQLFLQGTNDKLANIEMMREVTSTLKKTTLVEYEDADHSFKTPKAMGITQEKMFELLSVQIFNWIKRIVE